MSKKVVLRLGAASCAASLLTACGTSSSPSTATPPSVATLKTIVLQPTDLPSGWKGTTYRPDPTSAADDAAMSTCLGVSSTNKDKVAEAHSDDYSLANANVSSSASSYKSSHDISADIAALTSPKMSTCFDQLMRKHLATSMPAGAAIVSDSFKVTPGSAGGPANVVATGNGTITVSVSGQRVPIFLTVVFITGPLIEADVTTENVGTPVPASVMTSLVSAVASRAAKG